MHTPPSGARAREIPYNYTSFSDENIVVRFLGRRAWSILEDLRQARKTGRSAKMLFEVLGDLWVFARNPFVQEDLFEDAERRKLLFGSIRHRLKEIERRRQGNEAVREVLDLAEQAVEAFESRVLDMAELRKRTVKVLSTYTRRRNVSFDPLSRVSHSTDATDWRVELPFVVVYPDTEAEVVGLVEGCAKLGLTVIPRGGGTCYTGGAIPLSPMAAVINTEKLLRHSDVEHVVLPGVDQAVPTIFCEAGVVTFRPIAAAKRKGLVFACDPASSDASTIGGNVAMNAGGKNAVLWGTALDNLVWWKVVTPDAKWLEVTRIEHNLGKIRDASVAKFRLETFEPDGKTKIAEETLEIPGERFQKAGLGKDASDKFLSGLPGIQKEGCDGIVTSARFILHRPPKWIRTFCLEFFGQVKDALPSIVEIVNVLNADESASLCALEHLDERYIKAIGYVAKSTVRGRPRMVLIGDVGADDALALERACEEIALICRMRDGEAFFARSSEMSKTFWYERTKTSAIAKHTNAFKINEDVVIPLDRLGDYAEAIDRINIEASIDNKLKLCDALLDYFNGELEIAPIGEDFSERDFLEDRPRQAIEIITETRARWQGLLDNLDDPDTFRTLQSHDIVVSWETEIRGPLMFFLFEASLFEPIRKRIDDIHRETLKSRIFVATHMRAGDGNVHTNIPVNSADFDMLRAAARIVDRIMAVTRSLGGAVSGEHGVGITKLPYLTDDDLAEFRAYKRRVDPEDRFNAGKLMPGADLSGAFTPSFSLLEAETLFIEQTEVDKISDMIKSCLRCGKCNPVCMTHIPGANLLYSPRNKILGTSMLIETLLYEGQTRRGIAERHYDEFADIAQHCTICHDCRPPCPVLIDFGEVSAKMLNLIRVLGKRRGNPGSALSLFYLQLYDPLAVNVVKTFLIDLGFRLQRLGYRLAKRLRLIQKQTAFPPPTVGRPPVTESIIHFVNKPLPNKLDWKTARDVLNIEDRTIVPIIADPTKAGDETETVFYFPGCGSERLFSQVALATEAMLFHLGVQCVLPPGFLCCGNPQSSDGLDDVGRRMMMENQILFHRVAKTLNYLEIKTVLVSCGTCIDQLEKYEFDKIFPGSRLIDVHEYLLEKGIRLDNTGETKYLYHDPCHCPIKTRDPLETVQTLLGRPDVLLNDRCCGEAGTLAVSRPEVATQIRFCKQQEIVRDAKTVQPIADPGNKVRLLTTCPSCLEGLWRFEDDANVAPDYVVVELARRILGEHWREDFIRRANNGGVERVLL